jgi:hydroxymethylglutaryl-CoA reductase (NADPH)
MPTDHERARQYIQQLLDQRDEQTLRELLLPDEADLSPRLAAGSRITPEAVARRWRLLQASDELQQQIDDPQTAEQLAAYVGHTENFIGTAKVPLGIAGPLRVRGLSAQGDYYVPMATSEAALVASATRGAHLISRSGGCRCAVLNEGITRAPGFVFADLGEAGRFVAWLSEQFEALEPIVRETSRYARLIDMRFTVEGNQVYLAFEFHTGEAAGQNMATIATDALCHYIVQQAPVTPKRWYVEANLSGDKKASYLSLQGVRGKKVTAEATVPARLVRSYLHTDVAGMVNYYRLSSLGAATSGTIGIHGHYANPLAALYIACGQDVACVAESSVGMTRIEPTEAGELYIAITLPNLPVGTVGGGTNLPSARACLELLGLNGEADSARALSEVAGALVLACELSMIGALAAGEFAEAHRQFARGRAQAESTTPDSGGERETEQKDHG